MATTKASTKAAVLEDDETVEETEAEQSAKQIINEGIAAVIEATGIDVQKNRYKAMRAIAFEAFAQAIDAGTFDDLVASAIENIDELPSGWEIERVEKAAPVKAPAKAATKPTAKATPAKAAAAKPAARRRPTR